MGGLSFLGCVVAVGCLVWRAGSTSPEWAIIAASRMRLYRGLSRSEVVARFGVPVSTKQFPSWDLHYIIGDAGIDDRWILFRLQNDRVVETFIAVD